VMRDETAQHRVSVLDIAEVTGAVQAMQPGGGEFRKVADVVQPGSGFEQPGVGADGRREAARPGGDSLDVGPAAGKGIGEEGAGQALSPGGECVHEVQARAKGRDVHGRGPPSGDV